MAIVPSRECAFIVAGCLCDTGHGLCIFEVNSTWCLICYLFGLAPTWMMITENCRRGPARAQGQLPKGFTESMYYATLMISS
jgi:hypothetical protein